MLHHNAAFEYIRKSYHTEKKCPFPSMVDCVVWLFGRTIPGILYFIVVVSYCLYSISSVVFLGLYRFLGITSKAFFLIEYGKKKEISMDFNEAFFYEIIFGSVPQLALACVNETALGNSWGLIFILQIRLLNGIWPITSAIIESGFDIRKGLASRQILDTETEDTEKKSMRC